MGVNPSVDHTAPSTTLLTRQLCILLTINLLIISPCYGFLGGFNLRSESFSNPPARAVERQGYSILRSMSPANEPVSASYGDSSGLRQSNNQTKPKQGQTDVIISNNSQKAAAVEFAHLVGRLKVTPRTGWVRRGVPKYESVADHSWSVAALCLLLPNNFDVTKCIAMGVLHDLAESITGDICPGDNISKEEKVRIEAKATEQIASLLSQACGETGGDSSQSSVQQLMALFHEYEKRESKEAVAVKDLDLLDMIVQASVYEERFGLDLGEFFDGTPVSRFQTPELQNLAQEVHNQRKARIQTPADKKQTDSLSMSDAAFVAEFSNASGILCEEVEQVVKALRSWEETTRCSIND